MELDTDFAAIPAGDDNGAFSTSTPPGTCTDSRVTMTLCWRVHLLHDEPRRLPGLALVLGIGAGCVWLMFGMWLPVVAALLLLIGSTSEYLFPITYRLTTQQICQEALTSRLVLTWKDARRCRMGRNALLITSLVAPSRLDAFRGVLLRFAPDGQPGDRASVLAILNHYAPNLVLNLAPDAKAPGTKVPIWKEGQPQGVAPTRASLAVLRTEQTTRSFPPQCTEDAEPHEEPAA